MTLFPFFVFLFFFINTFTELGKVSVSQPMAHSLARLLAPYLAFTDRRTWL